MVLERAAAKGTAAIQQGAEAAAGQVQALAQGLQQGNSELCASMEQGGAADVEVVGGLGSVAAQAAGELEGFGRLQQAGLERLGQSIAAAAAQRLGEQPPAVPAAREVAVPGPEAVEALLCPPEGVLLEHFRAERSQSLRVGMASSLRGSNSVLLCCAIRWPLLVADLTPCTLRAAATKLPDNCHSFLVYAARRQCTCRVRRRGVPWAAAQERGCRVGRQLCRSQPRRRQRHGRERCSRLAR